MHFNFKDFCIFAVGNCSGIVLCLTNTEQYQNIIVNSKNANIFV